ncbi:DUF805 domain-containing protein [Lewinella sp. 4G2]|uniref:DUF805 domain-containing protein n=1 Tax=Lewinella sp. 4G2 TaxID=1803372 RepID=UPI0007B4804D|nr:hypothetical protein A3850_016735 [Lewinella sp. 4G2]
MEYFKLALSKYAQFTGRSRRSEYWYFTLVNVIISFVIGILATVISDSISYLGNLISLALFIPGLAVAVRRLHDVGRSGWWLLIAFTGIGIFVLLYWYIQDSEPGSNEYGPNPKTGATAEDVGRHLVD